MANATYEVCIYHLPSPGALTRHGDSLLAVVSKTRPTTYHGMAAGSSSQSRYAIQCSELNDLPIVQCAKMYFMELKSRCELQGARCTEYIYPL